MPRKKTTKKVVKLASAVQDALEPTAKDMLAEVMATQNEILKQNIELKAENNRLKDALIQSPAEGGQRIVGGEPRFEMPTQEEPMDIDDYAVFTSPFPGYQVKLIPGKKNWLPNGESEIVNPLFARFDKGICVLTEDNEIELMRAKEQKNKIKGQTTFREIVEKDQKEAARQGKLGPRSIKSQTVSVETSIADLL